MVVGLLYLIPLWFIPEVYYPTIQLPVLYTREDVWYIYLITAPTGAEKNFALKKTGNNSII